jgi:hypothetical protein
VQTSKKFSRRLGFAVASATATAMAATASRRSLPCLAAALTCVCVTTAWAQAPKVDNSAEAAAAMERAQRSAANPMRAILQAGKINVAMRADAPAPAPAPRMVAVAPVAVAPVAAVTAVVTAGVAAAVPAAQVSVVPSPVVAFAKPVEVLFKADPLLNIVPATEVQALEAPVALVAVAAQLNAEAPTAALVGSVFTPKLKHRVDPVLPQNVLDQVGQVREVRVSLNINVDGSVSDVVVQQPVPRQMVRYVQAAVAQWLFEPIPAARAHQVQLVFSTE